MTFTFISLFLCLCVFGGQEGDVVFVFFVPLLACERITRKSNNVMGQQQYVLHFHVCGKYKKNVTYFV